jgi:hypothetical protein
MWVIPSFGRDSEMNIYVSVRNVNSSANMLNGHGAFWYYSVTDGDVLYGDGYSVTHSPIATTNCANPALLCGVVAQTKIYYNEYGLVQKYGQHDAVAISGGASGHCFFDNVTLFASYTSWTQNKFTNMILKPASGAFATESSGAVANSGYFGAVLLPSATVAIATQEALDEPLAGLYPGGYAIPLGNVAATATYTSGTTVKAFLKMMG